MITEEMYQNKDWSTMDDQTREELNNLLVTHIQLGEDEISPCWYWMGPMSQGGHGRIRVPIEDQSQAPAATAPFAQPRSNYHWMLVHRVSYLIKNGKIPSGVRIAHLCNEPSCCNPNHLVPMLGNRVVQQSELEEME